MNVQVWTYTSYIQKLDLIRPTNDINLGSKTGLDHHLGSLA